MPGCSICSSIIRCEACESGLMLTKSRAGCIGEIPNCATPVENLIEGK